MLLFTTAEPPATGGAAIEFFPFTGVEDSDFPCCTGALDPVGAGEKVFVALAYDGLGCCAGTAVKGDDVPEEEEAAAVAELAALAGF